MIFVGEDEIKTGQYSFKDIINSKDYKLDVAGIIDLVTKAKRRG